MVGADVKNYIRPYYREGAVLAWWVTIVQLQGAVLPWAPAVLPRHRTVLPLMPMVLPLSWEQYYRDPIQQPEPGRRESGGSSKGKRRGQEGDVYVMIPPKPFQRGPPLNSTAFLRLKSTKKKHRKDARFNSL